MLGCFLIDQFADLYLRVVLPDDEITPSNTASSSSSSEL
jgi:hypothetical protein